MKQKYLLIILICMVIMPFNAKAEQIPDCSIERTAELSRIASNVKFDYSYDVNASGIPSFYVTGSNINSNIYVIDDEGSRFNEDFTRHYNNGQTITYTIYSNDAECRGKEIIKSYVTLPKYNYYSEFDECKGKSDLDICQKWTDNSGVTLNDFFNQVRIYDEKKAVKTSEPTFMEKIMEFLSNNRMIIFGIFGISIVISVVIFIINRMKFISKK